MRSLLAVLLATTLLGCAPSGEPLPDTVMEDSLLATKGDVEQRLAQFAPTEYQVDLSVLSDSDRQVLAKLVGAARLMDEIFLHQVATGNPATREQLATLEGAEAEAAREYFTINFGPWDRLDEMAPFLGETPHPSGAGYYPIDLSKEEFDRWIEEHPEDAEAFRSLFTVIRRQEPKLVAIPYSSEYHEWLEPAATLLREAAALTDNASLRRFLELRADAFLSDDYYESDIAWMELESPVEVTIGPYETYEDGLMGLKAAFEAFVTVTVPEESAALARYKEMLPWLEKNLPIEDEHKNLDRGTESPIRVVDVLFVAGDTKAGVQTLAYNLPNDERVREAKGSKKVMLRNTLQAKYEKILLPIAERVLADEDVGNVAFDAYFNESLHHELSHGLGPGLITLDGRATEVRLELKEHHSTLEEAKADVMGVYNILSLVEKGEMPADFSRTLVPTYVAGLFRSARFGVHEAHGQGVVSQFNYLLENGALEVDEEGRFHAVSEKFPGAIRDLLHEMLMLQAAGDYQGTAEFLDRYGKATPELLRAIDRLEDVPVDIRPVFPQANTM